MTHNESAYLELKGIIIDWARERHLDEDAVDPREVVLMLKRIIRDFKGQFTRMNISVNELTLLDVVDNIHLAQTQPELAEKSLALAYSMLKEMLYNG